MDYFQWVTDIIVPLLAALIGGGMTLIGVIITIRHDNKNREEDRKRELIQRAKPILINYAGHRGAETTVLYFSESGKEEGGKTIFGSFKNTDNGILTVDKIVAASGNLTYLPVAYSTVDKNTAFIIGITLANYKETFDGWTMYVHDIYDNPYCYRMKFNEKRTSDASYILLSGTIYSPENTG